MSKTALFFAYFSRTIVISYGIFGKAAGFSDTDLYEGSNLNQSFKNIFGGTSGSGDENRDVYMIETGIHNAQFLLKK